jgi:hypothetical protein
VLETMKEKIMLQKYKMKSRIKKIKIKILSYLVYKDRNFLQIDL